MADVEKRLRLAAESLGREVALFDADAFVGRLMSHVGAAASKEGAARETPAEDRPQGAAPVGPGGLYGDHARERDQQDQGLGYFRDELDDLLARIPADGDEKGGDPRDIRRVAELVELLEGDQAARPWWHRAAQSGDDLARGEAADSP